MEPGTFYDTRYFDSMERRYDTGAHGQRVKDILAHLPHGAIRVLDYGCGSGFFSEIARVNGGDITAYDFSEDARNYVKRKYPLVRVVDTKDDIENDYDAILALDIIEHLDYPMQLGFLQELREKLGPEGVLILSTDNVESFFSKSLYGNKLQHLDSRLTAQGRAYRKIKKGEALSKATVNYHASHVGLLSRNQIIDLARRAGLKLKKERHGFFYDSPLSEMFAWVFRLLPLHSVYVFSKTATEP